MIRRLTLTGLLLAWVAAPAPAQRTGASDPLPTRSAAARLGLERQWHTLVPLGAGHDEVLFFNVDGSLLFVHTSGGNLHAYDSESGKALWTASLGQATATALPVSHNSDQVIVTSLNTLFALDKATGRIIWKADLEDLPSTGTSADEDFAMVGLRSGKMVAYNTRDRTQKVIGGRSAGTFAWAWKSNGELSARPISTPAVVAFGSQDSRVYVATKGGEDDKKKPLLLFRFLTGGPISANLAVWGNRTLIVPSADNNVYAIDLFNGKTRWEVPTGSPVDQEPLVSGTEVFAINEEGRLLAIDGKTGEVLWSRFSGAERILAVSPVRLYLETEDQDLIIVDRSSGQILANARATHELAGLNLREFTLGFPNYQDDRLYFCTPTGLLVCLREAGRTSPVMLRDPSWPPFGTIPENGLLTDEDLIPTPGAPAAAGVEEAAPAEPFGAFPPAENP